MTIRAILADPEYFALKEYVLDHTGLTYFADKDEDLAARISRRTTALKIPDCSAYLALLRGPGGLELHALVGQLTIGETYFFRQIEHFDLLRNIILPDLARSRREVRRLRIWSAGCATGAEPYSIAILLLLEFAARFEGWDILILGTDINPEFLDQARAGIFSEWALRDLVPEKRACCFQQDARRWILNPEIRRMVTFRYHNLAADSGPPLSEGIPFDIILCRNVMIYFSREQSRKVAGKFYDALADGGWLLVGHAETSTDLFPQFELVREAEVTAYRKPEPGAEAGIPEPIPWQPWSTEAVPVPAWLAPSPSPVPIPTASPLRPPDLPPHEVLENARLLADRGAWKEAEAKCRILLAKDPLYAPAHLLLGLILPHTSSREAAETALRQAIYADRNLILAQYHLGTLLQTARDVHRARKAFRNTMDLLQRRPADEIVEYGDGMTVGELRELTRMHQEILGK